MAEFKKFDQKSWVKTNLNYKKDSGSWAWILHRITGIALIAYLFMHIFSLSPLSQGRQAFNEFIGVLMFFAMGYVMFSHEIHKLFK